MDLIVLNTISKTRELINSFKKENLNIGFVPTMGYLHEGHKSLIEKARTANDKVVVSIFVNPTQFGPTEDFEKYPRNITMDINLCKSAGVDLIFAPTPSEMYPHKSLTSVSVDLLSNNLCGRSRPGHFSGVCLVVAKLFNIICPTRAYFGKKDYQQLSIIKQMVNDLNFNVEIIECNTFRESDGLAQSSRNSYLSDIARTDAAVINKALRESHDMLLSGERLSKNIIKKIESTIANIPFAKTDYIQIVNTKTLEPIEYIDQEILVAVAVYFGHTRLIDNYTFDPNSY